MKDIFLKRLTKYETDRPIILLSGLILVKKSYLRDPKLIYEIQNVSTRSKTYLRDLSTYLRKLKSEQRIVLNNQSPELGDDIYQTLERNNKYFLN